MREKIIKSMIRINHAGEYAAKRLYEGQLKYIKDRNTKALIQEMAKGEEEHLEYFIKQMKIRRVRPTILYPLVDKIAYALGATTALLGTNAALVCTSAVEEVIAEHYSDQIKYLDRKDKNLKKTITKFRNDELNHKETADQLSVGQSLLHNIIKNGCKIAINLVRHI